ncbi:MAG: hypothetical protein JNL74_10910 [Fibrobacteres bacterium]|nr:hypothetical protein [Fibrobacterota bacterium]
MTQLKLKLNKQMVIIVLLFICFANADSIGSQKTDLSYANYLYNQQQYKESAREYLRIFFNTKDSSLLMSAADAYKKSGDTVMSIRVIDSLTSIMTESAAKDSLLLQNAKLSLMIGNYNDCVNRILSIKAENTNCERYAIFVACSLMNPLSIKTANINPVPINTRDSLIISESGKWKSLVAYAEPKKPLTAALLSTLLPGAGQFYSGRIKDGIAALSLIGICAFQSWSGFSTDGNESIKGWGFGIAGSIFYAGNIYGATESSKRYNSKRKEEFFKGIHFTINEQF